MFVGREAKEQDRKMAEPAKANETEQGGKDRNAKSKRHESKTT
jgi:hypothetical protein